MKAHRILLITLIPILILIILFQQIAAAEPVDDARNFVQTVKPADMSGTNASMRAQRQVEPDTNAESLQPSPVVQSMIDEVEDKAVFRMVRQLSGQLPALIGGQPYTISTRHTFSGQAISKTTRFVGQKLAFFGLDVEYHHWNDATNPNVIGELTGRRRPEEVYLVSAHLDSTSRQGLSQAPGADDNASGSTALLIIAEILGQYQWDCTLRFAFWTGEEQGLLGSGAYVERADKNSERIDGVLNLDMIGWNTPGSPPGIDLHASSDITGSMELAQLFANVVSAYELKLIPEIVPSPTNRSDHASFWEYGYASILAIEDFSDFNPYYHSDQDTAEKLDLDYYTEFVKASLGALVHMGECLSAGYLHGTVVVDGSASPIPGAGINAKQAWQAPITLISDASGYYSGSLPAGMYTVTASAVGYQASSISNTVVVTEQAALLNFSLLPRAPILLPMILRND